MRRFFDIFSGAPQRGLVSKVLIYVNRRDNTRIDFPIFHEFARQRHKISRDATHRLAKENLSIKMNTQPRLTGFAKRVLFKANHEIFSAFIHLSVHPVYLRLNRGHP